MKQIFLEMEKLKNLNSGLGQVCLSLAREVERQAAPDLNFTFYVPKGFERSFGDRFRYVRCHGVHRLVGVQDPSFRVWHCLHQDSKILPKEGSIKLILTIHDLNFLYRYTGFKRAMKLRLLQKKVDRAQVITVISRFTESEVRKHLKLRDQKVVVIPNGNSLDESMAPQKPSFVTFEKYLFSIGGIAAKKNFKVLLPLLDTDSSLRLIIAGEKNEPETHAILSLAKERGVEDRLILPGTVTGGERLWLYQNATAFVFPSLQEGFGLPVVEAMSLGKPTFLSCLASLPEVGGSLAFYWNTFDEDHMKEIFLNGMKSFNDERAHASREWTQQFSWKAASQKYLELYRSLL